MKKIINVTLLSIFVLAGVACEDGIVDLNKEPLGEPSSSILYTTEDGISKLLNGAYAQTRSFDMSSFGRFVAKEVGSDDANPGSTPADGAVPAMEQVSNFTYLSSQGNLSSYYNSNYTLIARANMVINNAPNVEMDAILQARYIGEAKFLRAFAYFNLVRGWGGVPIYTEVPANPEEAEEVKPRASEEEVYALIIEDLTSAMEALPAKSGYASSDLGRATKGAAQTMLAQVYIFQQDYQNTLNYAMEVINSGEYSLLDTYDQNFGVEYQNGPESIFEIQFVTRDERDISNWWNQFQGIRGTPTGWGFLSPTEDLANAYEEGDPRRDYTIFFEGEAFPGGTEVPTFVNGAHPRANQKGMLPQPWPVGYSMNSPMNLLEMRYADVLLMAAEANNELGNSAEALRYLEMIRARAREGNTAILPEVTTTNQQELRHKIWQERRFELALEGYRYYDIMRYDKVEQGFAEDLFHALGKTSFNPAKHTLFPIPQSEIDFSDGQLQQNPGW